MTEIQHKTIRPLLEGRWVCSASEMAGFLWDGNYHIYLIVILMFGMCAHSFPTETCWPQLKQEVVKHWLSWFPPLSLSTNSNSCPEMVSAHWMYWLFLIVIVLFIVEMSSKPVRLTQLRSVSQGLELSFCLPLVSWLCRHMVCWRSWWRITCTHTASSWEEAIVLRKPRNSLMESISWLLHLADFSITCR